MLAEFTREDIDLKALAAELQREGTAAFAQLWNDPMYCIAKTIKALANAWQERAHRRDVRSRSNVRAIGMVRLSRTIAFRRRHTDLPRTELRRAA